MIYRLTIVKKDGHIKRCNGDVAVAEFYLLEGEDFGDEAAMVTIGDEVEDYPCAEEAFDA
jgi:hypothetical protein